MSPARSNSDEVRSLISDGLALVDRAEYLEAIDTWETALNTDPSSDAALLCTTLLEDYLIALDAGEDADIPDFRGRLRAIGYDPSPEIFDDRTPTRDLDKENEVRRPIVRTDSDSGLQPRYSAAAPPPPAHRSARFEAAPSTGPLLDD
ncbi:MAG: hypothetical protein KC561_17370, partial [Myxococcales bacterium]|nr:hypothetical protein [Myxococcales bacterium]